MEYTPNYNLKKPGDQDNVLVGDLNENMDTVDATMKKLSDGKANLDPDTGKVPDEELPDDLFLKLIGGTMKGNIQMANFLVKGLPDPQEDGDAARKAYVDALRTYLDTGGFAKIQTGSYTGNGAYGQNNPNSITANFPPKFMFILDPEGTSLTWTYGATQVWTTSGKNIYQVSGNKIAWYNNGNTNADIYQMNVSGRQYYWVILG